MIYKCTYFGIYELVSPKVYYEYGERAWEFFDSRALITLDLLRKRYGRVIVNNWKWGGPRDSSGLRTSDSYWYSRTSQHTFGRAFDCLFLDSSVDAVREDILANPRHKDFKLINAVELKVYWLHFDVRNCDRIKTFYKKAA